MNNELIRKFLAEQYGLCTMEQIKEELSTAKLDIGVFTEAIK